MEVVKCEYLSGIYHSYWRVVCRSLLGSPTRLRDAWYTFGDRSKKWIINESKKVVGTNPALVKDFFVLYLCVYSLISFFGAVWRGEFSWSFTHLQHSAQTH